MSATILVGWMVLAAAAQAASAPRLEVVSDPAVLPALAAHCDGVESGWHAPRAALRRQVMAGLEGFPWRRRGYLAPVWGCHVQLELRCAPDLDADGEPELLARLRWSSRLGGKCAELPSDPGLRRYEAVAILARQARGGEPSLVVLDLVSHGAPRPADSRLAPLSFVRLPSGRAALRGESPSDPTGGCDLGGMWVGVVVRGRFVLLPSSGPEAQPCP